MSINATRLVCNILSLGGRECQSWKKSPPKPPPASPPRSSLLTSQWIYLVQFKIKHFSTLQFSHNRIVFIQKLPMKTELIVFSFYSRISEFWILLRLQLANKIPTSFQVLTSHMFSKDQFQANCLHR